MARKGVFAGAAPPVRAMVIPREGCNSRLTVARGAGVSYIPPMTPPALTPHSADALLFDLGRVVLDIDFGKVWPCWATHAAATPADLVRRFSPDDIWQARDGARSTTPHSLQACATCSGSASTDAQFLEGWNALFAGEMPGIAPMLARAAKRVPLYAFSNTNPPHVEHFSTAYADVLGHFRKIFLSSAIGLRKPDAEAYDHVVKAIGVPASRIVFFDDSAENIAGARARGLAPPFT